MEKISWWGNIESQQRFQVIIFLHQLVILKDTWKAQFLGFMRLKKDYPIMAATNLFGTIINIHLFEDGNGRICRLILAHVLIQMKCCLFPVILSSFHRRGRRHYIRAVKMFDRKPSMLYTMIVKSLIHCWDNFKQNGKMLVRCWRSYPLSVDTCPWINDDLAETWNLIKMSSVMPFSFNSVKL